MRDKSCLCFHPKKNVKPFLLIELNTEQKTSTVNDSSFEDGPSGSRQEGHEQGIYYLDSFLLKQIRTKYCKNVSVLYYYCEESKTVTLFPLLLEFSDQEAREANFEPNFGLACIGDHGSSNAKSIYKKNNQWGINHVFVFIPKKC